MSVTGRRTTSSVQSMMLLRSVGDVCSLCLRQGAGSQASGGDQSVEALVAFAQAGLHAARDHAVAGLDGGVDGVDAQSRASVAEVVERDRLEGHHVGETLELER